VSRWSAAIEACCGNSRALWSKLRRLLQPQSVIDCRLTADDFAHHFLSKIYRIRASTAAAPTPNIDDRAVHVSLMDFSPVTVDEVAKILSKSPAKKCQLDPAPTWLVKNASDVLAPVIAAACNASFEQRKFPISCKTAIVRPLLKKRTLEPNDASSYHHHHHRIAIVGRRVARP